jgi:ribonuclease E
VIIVDFIDMDSRRDQLQLLEHFNKALKADKSRPQIAQLSELGLVELTRKRQGQNIYELFGQTCPTCNGLGHIVHLPGERGIPHEEEELPEVAAATSQPIYEPGTPRFRTRVSAPAREVRDLVSSESPTWDAWGEGGGLESEADATESELLHHPSYQERGNGRRRRRRRPGEILKPTSAEERSPSFASKERYGAWEEGDRETSAELDVFASAPEDLTLATAKKGRPDRQRVPRKLPEPGEVKVSTELSKPAPEPKEVVVVEMTPQEQEVYAWMGVSPLVKINREIKNPRSVVVAVALPGQKPDGLGASLEPQLISALATEPLPEAPFLESEVVSSMSEGVPRPSRRLTFPVPQPDITQLPDTIAVAEIDRAEERSVELADVPDSDPSAASPEEPSTRRRRRRTSATSSDSPIGVIE